MAPRTVGETLKPRGRVLIIAGSDSGGGAGLQADVKTVTLLGGYAATAVTAITVQNTLGVHDVVRSAPRLVVAQIQAVMSDIGADVVKTGMLADKALVETVADALALHAAGIGRVIDPVMVATSGDRLLATDAVDAMRSLLVPGAALLTPNAPEAEVLAGVAVESVDGQRRAAERLLRAGAHGVLVKGGHIPGGVIVDVLATEAGETYFEADRVATRSTHGTGCTLASGVAAGLARGMSLAAAVGLARDYLMEALRAAPGFGHGAGPVDHGWPAREPERYADLLERYRI
ncbi:bifunctional hydroxymethylpyrimidine kinase/phosphomethylpyrimidine kinase [bacterium]|nr:bifunctional hydroxymethylpyrimidine kinase/phosphomethylpyrimidine kinase [bacterium]